MNEEDLGAGMHRPSQCCATRGDRRRWLREGGGWGLFVRSFCRLLPGAAEGGLGGSVSGFLPVPKIMCAVGMVMMKEGWREA